MAFVGRFVPMNQPGARRLDDRREVSGFPHMLRTGGRWRVVPGDFGPAPQSTTGSTGGRAAASGTPPDVKWWFGAR